LYRCHFVNREIIDQYQMIKNACGLRYDVVFLFDETNGGIEAVEGGRYHKANIDDIRQMGYRVWEGRGLHFHMDYALLHFYHKHPSYKYYWVLEYDVRFNGNWRDFFTAFEDNQADLLSTFVRHRRDDPRWIWWDRHNLDVPDDQLLAIFCPVVRFSRRALDVLHEKHLTGLYGYCEVVIPTIVSQAGLKVEDISERFYDPLTSFNFNGVLGRRKGKLAHPVKATDFFNKAVAFYRYIFRAKYDSHWSVRVAQHLLYKIFRLPQRQY
ncbi:MAG: hypothetical protein KGJ11_02845, partial [Candidatus Omnitrophica bacterium]|nr:hypothetical protein [Candidatus Omnitrophota bacterium]